jgi:hypothetical protein
MDEENMALIACAECKREISDKAATCPNCGAPPRPALPPAKANSALGGALACCFYVGWLMAVGGAWLVVYTNMLKWNGLGLGIVGLGLMVQAIYLQLNSRLGAIEKKITDREQTPKSVQ